MAHPLANFATRIEVMPKRAPKLNYLVIINQPNPFIAGIVNLETQWRPGNHYEFQLRTLSALAFITKDDKLLVKTLMTSRLLMRAIGGEGKMNVFVETFQN